eukprot:gnl/TRDRNA2_/TRDRNA2_208988_c0_seq1.p1 gnl/TRDRNA2_/TRDRNA2_208988_c0~~gnl/TRDRNA2_/TRDRNA2_208988_c0_seq1.p1  ORF type:complete len:171 (-),score=38.39 gnl/TRDRNA2_/TRDRNA2_208988_c0_seq1:189-662(-)
MDKEQLIYNQLAQKDTHVAILKDLFRSLDGNRTGMITVSEFEKALDDEDVEAYFSSLQLDINDAWTLFKLLDDDGSNVVHIDEFVMGCLRLRGTAKGIDIATLMYESRLMARKLGDFMKFVEKELGYVERDLKHVELEIAEGTKYSSLSADRRSSGC